MADERMSLSVAASHVNSFASSGVRGSGSCVRAHLFTERLSEFQVVKSELDYDFGMMFNISLTYLRLAANSHLFL